jgi:hypothetical protein
MDIKETKISLQQDQGLENSDYEENAKISESNNDISARYPRKKKHLQEKASHNPKKNLLKLSEALKNNLLRRKIKKQS